MAANALRLAEVPQTETSTCEKPSCGILANRLFYAVFFCAAELYFFKAL
jgi:hypothetical protein